MKMKKKLLLFSLSATISINLLSVSALAHSSDPVPPVEPAAISSNVTTRAEETEWHYRNYYGRLQKRLWSLTYAKWLTDWMYI